MRRSAGVLIVVFLFLITTNSAKLYAQSESLTYKKIKNTKDNTSLSLKNCSLFDGVSKIKITQGGKKVSLPTVKNRDDYSLGRKYKFFGCEDNTLYVKKSVASTPVSFSLSLDDFPKVENNLGSACKSVKSWPGSHIYKTIGSDHFSDIRRNTVGLILKYGASGPYPSCVSALDSKGKVVAKLGLYARGAGWAARYYAGIGCGGGTPYNGSKVAGNARNNTGSNNIYMDFGSVCYGPINATQCYGSAQC